MNFLIGGVEVSISFEDGLSIEWKDGYLEIPAPVLFFILGLGWIVLLYTMMGK